MQKKKTRMVVAVVLLLALAGVGCLLLRKPAAAEPVSSTASEEANSDPESTAASEQAAASASELPTQDEVSDEENTALEEEAESDSESADASSAAVADSGAAASRKSASSAAHSTAAPSHTTSSSQTSSTPSSTAGSAASDSIASLESFGDAKIDEYVSEIRSLQKRNQRQLYQTMSAAYDEYMQYPIEKRTLSLKVSIVLGKTAELTSMQSQCDKEFKAIIRELRTYLRENGYDQSIADEAEKEYQDKKDAMTKELTSLTYSQVTGSGDGSHWLIDHYDEMMGE